MTSRVLNKLYRLRKVKLIMNELRPVLHRHPVGVVVRVGAAIAGANRVQDIVAVEDPVTFTSVTSYNLL